MHEYGGFSPLLLFLVQQVYQLPQVKAQDLGVSVNLCEACIYLAKVVQGHDHGNSWRHLLDWYRVGLVLGSPNLPPEVHLSQPRFIEINDAPLTLDDAEEDDGPLLPQYQVLV